MRALLICLALLLAGPAAAFEQSQPPTFTMPFVQSVVGSGLPGLQGSPTFLWNGFGGSTFDTNATLRVDRDVETTSGGGKPWYTYKAFWALGTTGYTSPGFEWTITGELNNRTRKSAGAQNVAVNGTAWKLKTDNGEETGTTWALNGNCVDLTGFSDPTTSCIAAELDIGGAVGTDKNRQRVGLHIAAGGQPGAHVGLGAMISPGENVTIDRGLLFHPGGGSYGTGIDLSQAGFGGAAVLLGPEQWLALDGKADGSFGRFIGFHAGMVTFMTPFGPTFRLADDGGVYLGRVIEQIPHVPTSASSPCETGERAWDQEFEYRCVASGRWRRTALQDF